MYGGLSYEAYRIYAPAASNESPHTCTLSPGVQRVKSANIVVYSRIEGQRNGVSYLLYYRLIRNDIWEHFYSNDAPAMCLYNIHEGSLPFFFLHVPSLGGYV